MKSAYTYVAGLSNTANQYWATATPTTGAFSITNVIPGTYTLTIYKGELEVYTTSVTVTAGAGVALHTITVVDPSDDTSIFRIGMHCLNTSYCDLLTVYRRLGWNACRFHQL